MTLAGRTLLVSGATGAVGGELLRASLAAGASVGIAVRRQWQVQQLTKALPRATTLVGLVPTHDGEAAAGFVKGVEDSLGPIEALVSAAGGFLAAPAGDDRTGDAAQLFDANLFTAMTLVRAVLQPMRARGRGSVVLTGARVATGEPPPGMSLYYASKAALHAWARALANELEPSGLRVAVVAPGTIDTEANRAAMPAADRSTWLAPAAVAAALLEAMAGRLPGQGPLYALPPT